MSVALDAMLVSTPDVCGGRMRIDGTRITIHRVATLYRQGQGAEEIAQTYPHLTPGQVYAALAYYHANRQEIDSDLTAADALYDDLRRQEKVRRLAAILSSVSAEQMVNRMEFL